MIYAIGQRARYEPKLALPKPLYKIGKGVDKEGRPYAGGSVWATEAAARQFIADMGIAATHNVYGVVADWQADTEQLPGEPFRRLLRHAQLVALKPAGSPTANP